MPDNIFTLNCELCKGGHHEAKIILCDQCDRGCHLFCLNPPLEEVPEGHWVCPLCIEADAEGGAFRQGEEYSMSEFEQIANDFQREYFKDHDASTGPVSSLPTPAQLIGQHSLRPGLPVGLSHDVSRTRLMASMHASAIIYPERSAAGSHGQCLCGTTAVSVCPDASLLSVQST